MKFFSRRRLTQILGSSAFALNTYRLFGSTNDTREAKIADVLWHPDRVSERIVKSWYQEDLPEGPVAAWPSRGVKPAVAALPDLFSGPVKLAGQQGVLFGGGTKQALTWPVDTDAPYLHRWWLVISRCNLNASGARDEIPILTVNGANGGAAYRQPRVAFLPKAQMIVSQISDGTSKNEGGACARDPLAWTVLVGYRRGHLLQAVVNGRKSAGQYIGALAPNRAQSTSFMGDLHQPLAADFAIDCILIGQSEIDDGLVDRLTGWAMWRVGQQAALPSDHPYCHNPPRPDDETGPPSLYTYDADKWTAWSETPKTVRFASRGRPAPWVQDYTTVFFDDFMDNTIIDDITGAPSSIWYAPTHLTVVGVQAKTQRPSDRPSSYVHDPKNHTLALRLLYRDGWRTGAFSSVNNNGQGRFWDLGIFEIRAKMPRLPFPRPGLFPAFWAYGREHLFWRTRNRLETDFWEYDGLDGTHINVTQHVHKPALGGSQAAGILSKDVRFKIAGYRVDTTNDFAQTIDIYDGEFHTWYAQIEEEYSYFVIDGHEVARMPTTPELAAQKYIMVDFAYDERKGRLMPDPSTTYDMVIDYIKVRQKSSDLAKVPPGFDALPVLSGEARSGHTLTVIPNTSARHLEYLWYRDGVPIVGEHRANYTLRTVDIGHRVRCQVRGISLIDQPTAWTADGQIVN